MKRRRWLEDPILPSVLLFSAIVFSGFIAIALGWRVAARTLVVGRQIPALVSGALGGLALVVIGTALISIQVRRRLAAAERAELDAVIDALDRVLALARRARS